MHTEYEAKRILITGVGGPTPRGVARALKRFGKKGPYTIIGTDCNANAIGLYATDLFDRSHIVPRASDKMYWDTIKRIVRDERIDAAIVQPEDEVEAWSEYMEKNAIGTRVFLPPSNLVRLVRDKALSCDLLHGKGLAPATIRIAGLKPGFRDLCPILGLPFWLRASKGTSAMGALKVTSERMFAAWLELNPGVDEFIASPFLPGRNLACKLLYWNGRLLRSVVGERVDYIMAKVAPSGITGNTSFGRLLNDPAPVEIAQTAVQTLAEYAKSKLHGFFTVDLKEDKNGNPLVTEVNPRHIAFTSIFAEAGANIAEDMVQVTLDDPDIPVSKYHQYTFSREWEFLRDVDSQPFLLDRKDRIAGG